MKPVIQVAGVIDREEAEMLIAAGATHLGFPLDLPDGREDLEADAARELAGAIAGRAVPVLITYLDDAQAIAAAARGYGAVQLHGPIPGDEIARLRRLLSPPTQIWKALVVGVSDEASLRGEIVDSEHWVDAYITDTFDPRTRRRGATGQTHDWQVSRRLACATRRPLILAGGLNPGNVAAAIAFARPAGVDAHTGLEGPDGRKTELLVRAFVDRARSALAEHSA